MFRPLEGVRVLDLSRVLAGPYAAKLLQDLGCRRAARRSPVGGRHAGLGPSLHRSGRRRSRGYWTSVNLGKQVIRRDLRKRRT
ncbi:MAG: hypothetical protein CM15mP18_3220 [Methanobacteriota archaeon]|nr:MAG: hypothetical protein CM15mP18_3220 [Euryarchaeota archaeon]